MRAGAPESTETHSATPCLPGPRAFWTEDRAFWAPRPWHYQLLNKASCQGKTCQFMLYTRANKTCQGKTCQFILYTRANKTCQKGKPACQGKLGRACVGLKPFSSCLSTWRRWSAPSSWLQLRMISPPPILYPLFCTLKALFYKILRLHYYIGMIILGQCSHLC